MAFKEINCEERLTWKQIQEKYQNQWVGILNVEYEPDNTASIKSAVVKYTDNTSGELTRKMLQGKCIARYTTPDNCMQLGLWG